MLFFRHDQTVSKKKSCPPIAMAGTTLMGVRTWRTDWYVVLLPDIDFSPGSEIFVSVYHRLVGELILVVVFVVNLALAQVHDSLAKDRLCFDGGLDI